MSAELKARQTPTRRLPGEVGLWIFIFSDLLLFALYFGLCVFDRAVDPVGFREAQGALNTTIALFNTLVLLSGSWAVFMATRVTADKARAATYVVGAALCGVLFLILKVYEYAHLIGAGRHFIEGRFFTWYFFLTGYHALHVMAGIVLLWVLSSRYRGQTEPSEKLVEGVGCYWHLVDLLWIGIFLVLYLL